MYANTIFFSAIMALFSTSMASPIAVPEEQLEARQAPGAIRLWSDQQWSGRWADLSITAYDSCLAIPSAMKDNVSSFRLGEFNCRFFEHDNCAGRNSWFNTDIANLRAPSGNGYDGRQNDEFSSVICVYK
ncbi:Beta/gamma crystallin [Neofusicoccum parvum]|uniref:Beta gamma crystallin protein n=2 Tax=Neofusicoccum TaxID=407951 RepID=A0ABR3SWY0_9PEZI|nr:putative beta gamma crystallin protein [Neofusicoccum parvum UCRNP2]GME36565.1 Beta/gamma crystallin [Neofusicoccum parvum]